ncbi:hypothetical protein P872_06095 [Rhodonellum psychrophilum GCM71 = DSM 17998]|uniref:Conjugative transposon TraM C-terminal domain-containing protein n=2 Tax=Rhodonellum TaxID=336827 RepID=U5C4B4_9BACT|nr:MULTISPECIES: conjugative transposon protein TraM [Rhodonellum]ERM83042.1 hypothetical protein P872_06095 [Rhodonellum psychrophilum GCM71 = DSM 17998]SDZ47490.1 Bacteroides conjugative transposon TraM protein [Rhodonellum ikkaensis]
MKIDFKKPKYILPIILLPFVFLLNYSIQPFYQEEDTLPIEGEEKIQESIGDVSDQIRKRGIDGKLDAFRSRYKSTDGYTAIKNLKIDVEDQEGIPSQYNEAEKRMLDSIDNALRKQINPTQTFQRNLGTGKSGMDRSPNNNLSKEDEELLQAIEQLQGGKKQGQSRYEDPMELFRAQMAVIDSISKANDPGIQIAKPQEGPKEEARELPKSKVLKADYGSENFNTVGITETKSFIKAILDEDFEKGSLGGRMRIRLLEDIQVGNSFLKKGTYLYALISGYDAQRVKLSINSVLVEDKIHPVQLSIYDVDGMEGVYVPVNSFRQFSKELGGNATGGMNVQMQQDPGSMNQFYMSTLQKLFSSTSQAMSKSIRQNRVNLKYGTFIYLIDPDDLLETESFHTAILNQQ